jgi:hypothetical protein
MCSEYTRAVGSRYRGRAAFSSLECYTGRFLSPLDPLRAGEHLHGHLGWLAVIALVHPAVLLRRPARRAPWSVGLAVAVVTLTAAIGVTLYPAYRETLRQPIFASSMRFGYLFEQKEHLAFGAVMFAWTGAVGYVAEGFARGTVRAALRRAAHLAFVGAATFAFVAAVLGTLVATYKTF